MLAVLDLVAGTSILAIAVVGFRRSRTSAVLAAAAAATWFATSVVPPLALVHRPLLLHAVLVLPTGRFGGLLPWSVVGAAWLGVVLPAEAAPWASVSVAALCAVEGLRRRSGRASAISAKSRFSGAALLALATGLALPVVERAVWPQLTHTVVPITTYLAATIVACALVVSGLLSSAQQEADAVIELSADRTTSAALAELALLSDAGHDPTRRHALRTAVDLLQDNVRLHAELSDRIGEVRRSRGRIIDAATAERQRLERVLADGVQRYLDEIDACLRSVRCPDEPATRLRSACLDEVSLLREEVTDLARGLHPRVLVERGLGPALVELTRRSPVPVDVRAPARRYPERTETTVWYACAEALANVWKHADATRAAVHVEEAYDTLCARVRDDGVGGAHLAPDGGLTGLADRLADVGGRLTLTNPGSGTELTITVPLR